MRPFSVGSAGFALFSVFGPAVTVLRAQSPPVSPASDLAGKLSANPVTTLWNVLLSGGVFMLPLVALLFVGTLLVMINFLTLRRGYVITRRYLDTTEALLRKRDLLGLLAVSNRHGEAVARVLQRTLDFATKNPAVPFDTLREIAETEAVRQASTLSHRITYLADVGTIAPMVGLLGTVSGMIKSFSSLANDVATSKAMLLSQGVSEALVCTASGLVVGIIAFSFYAYFRGRVQRLTADLESASTQVMALLAMHYQPGSPGSVGGAGEPRPAPGNTYRRRERPAVASVEDDF